MAIKRKAGGRIRGLSSDSKPTAAAEPIDTVFEETDTGNEFRNSGSAWNFQRGPSTNIGPERWYIYRTGTGSAGPYKALNKRTGIVVYSGASLDEVLDPVLVAVEAGDQGTVTSFLSTGGIINIDGSDVYYYCSAGFDGFTIPPYTTIQGPLNARIIVPQGYASYVFRIPSWYEINPTKHSSSTQGITIRGMSLAENGTVQRNWTGILVEGFADPTTGSGGVAGCRVDGTRVNNPKTGLMLNQKNTKGWITTCWFEKMYISGPKWAGVDQQLFGADPVNNFGNNVFRDIAIQSTTPSGQTGTIPAYGFRNMGQERCIYDNCLVWDVTNGQIKGNIDPTTRAGTVIAEDNVIIGGILAHEFDLPSTGTFASSNALVQAGYYTTGDPYPKFFQDVGQNTMVYGDFRIGNQISKIYIPTDGLASTTATLNIEGRHATASTQIEFTAANDSVNTTTSYWNKSRSERFYINRTPTITDFDQIKQTAGGTLRPVRFRMNDVPGVGAIESFRILINGDIQIADTRNIVLNATTGTKIGTATTQKLGFYNKAPIIQPTAIASPTADVASLKTAVDALRAALTSLGLTA